MNDHEDGLLRFIAKDRRERVRHLLGKKGSKGWLAHFGWFDERYVEPITGAAGTSDAILAELKRRGAPEHCYVISEETDIDGTEIALAEALEKVLGLGMGTVLSLVPGKLAYYEGEGPNDRYILRKREDGAG